MNSHELEQNVKRMMENFSTSLAKHKDELPNLHRCELSSNHFFNEIHFLLLQMLPQQVHPFLYL